MCSLFQNPLCGISECDHFVVTWTVQEYSCGHLVCAGIFLQSSVLLCGHIGLNKTKHRNRLGISTLNSPLTVQFNVPKKCYEFKPNTELLKTYVNAMNTLEYVTSHEIVVRILYGFLLPNFLENIGE